MDVLYFLKERTRLIRQSCEQAAKPFSENIRKIEAEEEPFVPPYSENPEPAFLAERMSPPAGGPAAQRGPSAFTRVKTLLSPIPPRA